MCIVTNTNANPHVVRHIVLMLTEIANTLPMVRKERCFAVAVDQGRPFVPKPP